MDIFRSKEVYRKVRKRDDINAHDPIIPVRGMYVVGQYLVPEYKGSGIEVTGIYTTRPQIVDFTERSESVQSDHISRLLDITMNSNNPIITRYTLMAAPDHHDHISKLLDIGMRDPITFTRYSRQYKEEPSDHITRFLGVGMCDPNHTIQRYYRIKLDNMPEPTVIIRNLTTGKITITDD